MSSSTHPNSGQGQHNRAVPGGAGASSGLVAGQRMVLNISIPGGGVEFVEVSIVRGYLFGVGNAGGVIPTIDLNTPVRVMIQDAENAAENAADHAASPDSESDVAEGDADRDDGPIYPLGIDPVDAVRQIGSVMIYDILTTPSLLSVPELSPEIDRHSALASSLSDEDKASIWAVIQAASESLKAMELISATDAHSVSALFPLFSRISFGQMLLRLGVRERSQLDLNKGLPADLQKFIMTLFNIWESITLRLVSGGLMDEDDARDELAALRDRVVGVHTILNGLIWLIINDPDTINPEQVDNLSIELNFCLSVANFAKVYGNDPAVFWNLADTQHPTHLNVLGVLAALVAMCVCVTPMYLGMVNAIEDIEEGEINPSFEHPAGILERAAQLSTFRREQIDGFATILEALTQRPLNLNAQPGPQSS